MDEREGKGKQGRQERKREEKRRNARTTLNRQLSFLNLVDWKGWWGRGDQCSLEGAVRCEDGTCSLQATS